MNNEDKSTKDHDDFSDGVRGKSYRSDAVLKQAVYLDQDVQDFFMKLAAKKGVEMSVIINDVLKKTIALLDVLR
jgi:hypothetical protein